MKEDFLRYQAQTTPHPLAMEITGAEGSYIFDKKGNSYLDFIAGVSANSLGHKHPEVVKAIKQQLDAYMHVMVYGEYIQSPAVELTKLLASLLPDPLETTYLTNSGTEATEGAIKLAKKHTNRTQIIAANNAYHGNTQGAMSVMGFEERKQAFRPLIPDTHFIPFNDERSLNEITTKTAAVILETIQGGAGFIEPQNDYLKKVRARCNQVGALLILDEIQSGFGRTGTLFGFQNYDVIPDIIIIGKGMGGGMPVGAFTASKMLMDQLKDNPKLGHITTFGGHPVIAASCLATLKTLTSGSLINDTIKKELLFRSLLIHPLIKEIRGKGLMLALIFENEEIANHVILKSLENHLILFWLLFEKKAVRITPPLTISEDEIRKGCTVILKVLEDWESKNVN
ncbi:aminotransferase class III-fold pyridoxal phosphate-dependent enzyme [Flavobacteriaceae bacterium R38]|nr:aminotransferase class III-fold pyridoxal phosphate-dependent enzyme [Flavobacteriaceae bacterium R38]